MFLRTFRWSFGVSAVALVAAFLYGGPAALVLTLVLGVMEVSLSFDNAVVNARVLERMSDWWQQIFLTVGIVIAVFGMRLLFPLLMVGITADLTPARAFSLAMEKGDHDVPGTYGYLLNEAHPQIAGFGGMFLLLIFLNFILAEREIHWLGWVERPLAKIGRWPNVPVMVALATLLCISSFLVKPELSGTVLVAGLLGTVTYLVVSALGNVLEKHEEDAEERASTAPSGLVRATGKAAFGMFLYLEVLDASFSFDGVIGAFAITSDPIIIALGLGLIGAIFVRSMTIYLIRKGTLNEFVHLDHGAHWAIGALAVILLATINFHISEFVTGFIGVGLVGLAFWTSIVRNRREKRNSDSSPELTPAAAER
ncbi:MAG: DUF475 domain-containing protein [Micrococcales bacterium]|nr:DUF475 domain-containing protein [Micrococcales bacterium]